MLLRCWEEQREALEGKRRKKGIVGSVLHGRIIHAFSSSSTAHHIFHIPSVLPRHYRRALPRKATSIRSQQWHGQSHSGLMVCGGLVRAISQS